MADWNIFESSMADLSTAEATWTEIRSKVVQLGNNLRQIHGGQIEIASSNNDAWYDLSNAYLEVRFQLSRGDGLPLAEVPAVGPPVVSAADVNKSKATLVNHGWNLFRKAVLAFSDNQEIDVVDYPGVVALTHAYSKYAGSRLSEAADNEFFYPEKSKVVRGGFGAAFNDTHVSNILGAANPFDVRGTTADNASRAIYSKENTSYARRYERTRLSKVVNLKLPLRTIFGYCDNLNHPIRGIPFSLYLDRNEDWNQIIHGVRTAGALDNTPSDIQAVILTCSLWVQQLKPSAEVAAKIESALLSENDSITKYLFENRNCYFSTRFAASAAAQQVEYKVQTSVARPSLVFVGFQSERMVDAMSDAILTTDPLTGGAAIAAHNQLSVANFGLISSHLNDIQRVEVRCNAKQYPKDPYIMTFAGGAAVGAESWLRAYYDFVSLFYKNYGENPKVMDFETWYNAPIFAFKIDFESGLYDQAKSVDITVRATVLSQALGAAADVAAATSNGGNFRIFAVVYSDRELNVQANSGRLVMYV